MRGCFVCGQNKNPPGAEALMGGSRSWVSSGNCEGSTERTPSLVPVRWECLRGDEHLVQSSIQSLFMVSAGDEDEGCLAVAQVGSESRYTDRRRLDDPKGIDSCLPERSDFHAYQHCERVVSPHGDGLHSRFVAPGPIERADGLRTTCLDKLVEEAELLQKFLAEEDRR